MYAKECARYSRKDSRFMGQSAMIWQKKNLNAVYVCLDETKLQYVKLNIVYSEIDIKVYVDSGNVNTNTTEQINYILQGTVPLYFGVS